MAEQRRLALRIVGVLALLAAVTGAVVWAAVYSPLGFQRFDVLDGGRSLNFRSAGEYVVYDERPLRADGTPAGGELSVVVQAEDGSPVEVTEDSGEHQLPLYSGRSVGRFTLDEPGTYVVRVNAVAPVGLLEGTTAAVAHARSTTWLGSLVGLAVLCALPGVGGVVALVASRRRETPVGELG